MSNALSIRRDRARDMLEACDLYAAGSEEEREEMISDAVELVGCQVTDSEGRNWVVQEVGTKDGWPTIGGGCYWDRADNVTNVCPPSGIDWRGAFSGQGAK